MADKSQAEKISRSPSSLLIFQSSPVSLVPSSLQTTTAIRQYINNNKNISVSTLHTTKVSKQ